MIITKKAIPRRTVLRGLGATLALPLLDSMVPVFTATARTAANPTRRFGAVYLPNGMNVWKWEPASEGAGFEITPVLEPLAGFRDQILVLGGLSSNIADSIPGEGGGDHSRGQVAYLTGVHAKKTQGSDIYAGISMDQIVANEYGKETQLASLELGLESNDLVGGCELGLACAYTGTIAWKNATTPLPIERDPRAVFERLFGASGSTDQQARLDRIERDRSILDSVTSDLARLEKKIGPTDHLKLTEYLDAIRDIERRIQKAEEQSNKELPVFEQPAGIPPTFEEHAKLMFDLMALAYQTDLTRVATYLMGREQSTRTYPEVGAPDPHHPTSHHNNNPESLEKLAKINIFHVKMFAHFLERLRSTPDGDGSVLDHSIIMYGAGLSNPDVHDHHGLPILLAGGGAGQLNCGRHIRYKKDTPLANLHMSLIEKMGINVEKWGDATGKLEMLSDV